MLRASGSRRWAPSEQDLHAPGFDSSASLLGGVYPNGQATTFYWQYGATVTYSSRTKGLGAGSGAKPVVVTAHLTELKPGTRYHYRLVAVNATSTTYGYDGTFVTSGRSVTAGSQEAPAASWSPRSVTVTTEDARGRTQQDVDVCPDAPVRRVHVVELDEL